MQRSWTKAPTQPLTRLIPAATSFDSVLRSCSLPLRRDAASSYRTLPCTNTLLRLFQLHVLASLGTLLQSGLYYGTSTLLAGGLAYWTFHALIWCSGPPQRFYDFTGCLNVQMQEGRLLPHLNPPLLLSIQRQQFENKLECNPERLHPDIPRGIFEFPGRFHGTTSRLVSMFRLAAYQTTSFVHAW